MESSLGLAVLRRGAGSCNDALLIRYVMSDPEKQQYLMEKLALGQRPECHPAVTGHTEKL